eukprot:12890205-Prorocentrum_lima.AAC.1
MSGFCESTKAPWKILDLSEGHVGTQGCSTSIRHEAKSVSSRDWPPARSHRPSDLEKVREESKPVTGAHCGFLPQMTRFISTHVDDIKGGATD